MAEHMTVQDAFILLADAAQPSPKQARALLTLDEEITRLRRIEQAAQRYVTAPDSCAEACETAYEGLRVALDGGA